MSVKKNLIDQKEYLKKYLSGDKKKKKKDKKHKKHESRLKIIDDNLFAHEANDIDEELLITGEDAPQIVGEVIELEPDVIKATKWRNIAIKDEPTDDNEESKYNADPADLWGVKKEDKQIKHEYSPKQCKIKKEPVDETKTVDSDLSPPRNRHRIDSDSDLCLRRRGRSESSDMSLPRRRQTTNRDKSISKRRRERSNDSDLSLPRGKRKGSYDSDMSLKRRRRPDRNNTNSSARRRRRAGSDKSDRRSDDSDLSLPRRRKRVDSPPRQVRDQSRNEKHMKRRSIQNPEFIHSDNDSDLEVKREILSPNNTKNKSSRSSPVVRIKEEKLTPPRKKQSRWNKPEKKSSSPPPTHKRKDDQRRRNERKSSSPPPTHRQKSSPIRNRHERKSSSPPPTHKGKTSKTLDGKKAGLQDAQSLKLENEKRRREEEKLFEEMSKDVSGRDAEIAVRKSGRKGRRGREAAEETAEEREQREHREKEKKEVYDRWGKGVKQVEDYRQRLEQDAYEASKPLARYSNDEDLDRYLREQEHAEDPMLQYMREKKRLKAKEDNIPMIPKYEGSFPENRFGIRPGYRWDGVDRSNGYEKRWFEVRNEKRAREEEAYKYSVEDM